MKFIINDIEYCKNNYQCNWPNSVYRNCSELCKDKFTSFKKNYSETIDLIMPNKELTADYTEDISEDYYEDKELNINIIPLKRYIQYKEAIEKYTFLYLVIKYIKEMNIFESDIQDYIINKLESYDEETSYKEITYEDIIYIVMDFNDLISDEILENILLKAISKEFTDKFQINNTKLNIVNENTIKNILKRIKVSLDKDFINRNFNFEHEDWHPCSGYKNHNYNYGINNCSLGNSCDNYDEENPCGDMSYE